MDWLKPQPEAGSAGMRPWRLIGSLAWTVLTKFRRSDIARNFATTDEVTSSILSSLMLLLNTKHIRSARANSESGDNDCWESDTRQDSK